MSIEVWADGSGTLSDGPACIGVVVFEDGAIVEEVGEYIGNGTNNVAELRAIRRGLYLVTQRYGESAPVTVFSDSQYAINAITSDSYPKENRALVLAVRSQVQAMSALRFEHVEGHSKIYGNELADWLAWGARVAFFASQGIEKKPRRRPEPNAAELEEKRSGLVSLVPAAPKAPAAPKRKLQPWERGRFARRE